MLKGIGQGNWQEQGGLVIPAPKVQTLIAERAELLRAIWRQLGLYNLDRAALFDEPIARLAGIVGALPASADYHAADPGGLLTHSLETALHALEALEQDGAARHPEVDPVQREIMRLPWQYAAFMGALLHDIGKVFYLKVLAARGECWDPFREGLCAFARRTRSKRLLVHHLPGRGLYRHERLAARFLPIIAGPEGESFMGPEVVAKLLQHASGAHQGKIQAGSGQRLATAIKAGDVRSVRQDRVQRAAPLPGEAAEIRTLADDVMEGITALLTSGELKVNARESEVYVGAAMTALVVPVSIRTAIEHMRRLDPTNRRLWCMGPREEAPAFNALTERGWLHVHEGRCVVHAKVHYLGPGHATPEPLAMIVVRNEVIWKGLPRPAPFAGRLEFRTGKEGKSIDVPGFVAEVASRPDTAAPTLPPVPPVLASPPDVFAGLLEDLSQLAKRNKMQANRPGGQLFIFGDEALVVIPKAILRAMAFSSRGYPEPFDLHMNAAYDALAATGRVRVSRQGRVYRQATLEHMRGPLGVMVVDTAALLDEQRRKDWGDYPGSYTLIEDEGERRP